MEHEKKRGPREGPAKALRGIPGTKWAGQAVFYYEETDSTNMRARAIAEEGCLHGSLVVAKSQSAGRGRLGRKWHSPEGGIYMSLILRPDFPASKARMLTLIAALSAAEAIKECTGLKVGIKWPNDLVAGGKKAAGILTEMALAESHIAHIVIGFGINANIEEFPKELANTATSLKKEGGAPVRVSALITEVLKHFEHNYGIFAETADMGKLKDKYNALLINKGRAVTISEANGTYQACAAGIDREGELIVRKADGTVEAIYAGEVSVS